MGSTSPRRTATIVLAVTTAATSIACSSAGGPCSVTTMGDVALYASCDAGATTQRALLAHSQRHVALGHRFGPFLGPWTAVRRLLDLFRSDGWSGPTAEPRDPAALAGPETD